MLSWLPIVDIGHTAVMLPVAGAVGAWLAAAGAWRLALWWSLIFMAGLGVVALSKIAYLGWALDIQAIGFKALSGHAWRSSAVVPVVLFLALQRAPARWRLAGVGLAVVCCAWLCVLLVAFRFHTTSEVGASFALGLLASGSFLALAWPAVPLRGRVWPVPASLLAFLLLWTLEPSRLSHRLVDVALYLSGREQPYSWSRSEDLRLPPAGRFQCRLPAGS